MRQRSDHPPDATVPSLVDRLTFTLKASALRARRLVLDTMRPLDRYTEGATLRDAPIVAESRTPLRTAHDRAERRMVAGKIQNLRIALRRIDGIELPAGGVFGFWRHVGRASRRAGFVHGRELREGCIVPTVGGGLCQLSNALYDAALTAGLTIVERHPHTRVIPGSLAERDRDATIFWNYLDLRFGTDHPLRIEARLERDELVVRLRSHERARRAEQIAVIPTVTSTAPRSCATCGETACSRNAHAVRIAEQTSAPTTAWLLDDHWPEYERLVHAEAREGDLALLPRDARLGRGGYRLAGIRGMSATTMPLFAVRRSLALRRVATQGAERQRRLIALASELAARFERALPFETEHLVVMQSMLPALARTGALGGRSYDVLMTGLPIAALQERLDEAATLHPESPTLGDFRTSEEHARIEAEALTAAQRIITPHREIAALYADRATLLDWHLPAIASRDASPVRERPRLLLPCSTLGRKGVYELRDATDGLDVEIVIAGRELEGDRFWRGRAVSHRGVDGSHFDDFDALVLPSFVEHRPRRALEAIARGIPVIVSDACGIAPRDGVTVVPRGDVDALRRAIVGLR